LKILEGRLAVCRLDPDSPIPHWGAQGQFYALCRTPDELSILCEESQVPPGVRSETGFRAIRVSGTLAFHLTGVLSSLINPLAEAGIPIFAVSTFDTDYLLIREADLESSKWALEKAGHTF